MKSDADGRVRMRPLTNEAGEIDLVTLSSVIWRGWKTVAAVAIAFVLLAILYLHLATYKYTAQLTVTPVAQNGSLTGGNLRGLGGLASIAGIALPTSANGMNFQLYAEGMYSRSTADTLAADPRIMRTIFASEWDAVGQRWRPRDSAVRTVVNAIKPMLGAPVLVWSPPDGARLQTHLNNNLIVNQDDRRSITTLSYDHGDPDFALYLLAAIHRTVDDALRARALLRASENVDYLEGKLATITVADYRESLLAALAEQEKLRMAASSSAPYAAEPFGAVNVSDIPTNPRAKLVLAVGVVIGLLAGMGIVVLIQLLRELRGAARTIDEPESMAATPNGA